MGSAVFILKRFKDVNAVSLAEKKAEKNTKITIVTVSMMFIGLLIPTLLASSPILKGSSMTKNTSKNYNTFILAYFKLFVKYIKTIKKTVTFLPRL